MNITEIDLEVEDIEWYGIDETGRIARFTSGGSKRVPEFIRESREKLDTVCAFFENLNPNFADEIMFNEVTSIYPRKEYLQECKKTAQKGLFCFDISDEQYPKGEYKLMCKPSSELRISDLPETIQCILRNYIIPNSNFSKNKMIYI